MSYTNFNPAAASSLFLVADLGKPVAASTTYCHAAITLTASPQHITTGITNPDVPRIFTITTNSAQTGNVVLTFLDAAGTSTTDTIALGSTTTTLGVKAGKTLVDIYVPAYTNGGSDTVAIGIGAALGLGFTPQLCSGQDGWLDKVLEATKPTFVFDQTTMSKNVVTLNSSASMANTKRVVVTFYAIGNNTI